MKYCDEKCTIKEACSIYRNYPHNCDIFKIQSCVDRESNVCIKNVCVNYRKPGCKF